MFERVLGWTANLCFRRSGTIIIVALALLLIAVVLALRLEFSADIRQLLPQSHPRVNQYFEALSRFAGSETLIGVVRPSGTQDVHLVQEFVKHFGESVSGSRMVGDVDFNANQLALRFFRKFFLKHIFLFLDEQDFNNVIDALSKEGMSRALKQARATLISQAGIVQKEFIEHDPLNLRRFMFKYSPKLKQGLKLDLIDGYYFSADHKMGFVLIYPTKNPQDLDFDRALLASLRESADEAFAWQDNLHGWAMGEAAQRLSISFTGPHAILLEESGLIKDDTLTTLISSFALVVVLFVVAFRSTGSLLFVGGPLLSSLVFTLALCYVTLGYINILTIVLVVSVVGLGIDFAVHLYSRFVDERASGRMAAEALRISYTRTGSGTLACAATTSLAFLSCALSRFQGVKHIGLLAAAGIVICLSTTFFFMGAVLKQQERLGRHKVNTPRAAILGLTKLARLVTNHPGPIIAVWTILTLLAAIRVSQVKFSEDITKLRAKTSQAARLQTQISRDIGGSFKDWIIFKTVPDSEAALKFAEHVKTESAAMIADGTLAAASSLLDFVPSLARQLENIRRLERLSGKLSPRAIAPAFEAAVEGSGLRMTDLYREYINQLAASLSVKEPIDLNALAADKSVKRLLRRFLEADSSGLSIACYVSPAKLLSAKRDAVAFEHKLRKRLGNTPSIVSTTYLTAVLKDLIVQDIWLIAIVAAVLVLAILLMQFRNLWVALIAIVPLGSGALMMLATASMLGIDLNPVNLFVVPMILGIGIDDGIHLVHRFLEKKAHAQDAIVGTGKALILTSLTTILAFGTLVFAGFEGLVQIGIITILGVGFSLLASITFLPALLVRLPSVGRRLNVG
ncbi:MAG TPA: MMPL family transporter [bacterium]|nr:MMPL family transporter [bacterium]